MSETVSKTVKRRAPNPAGIGGFSKDAPRPGPGRGKKKPKQAVGEAAFADMRAAYETDERPGERPGVTAARVLLHESYEKFMTLYAKLAHFPDEADRGKPLAAAATPGEVGPKEENVVELAERLLSEWEAGAT